MQNVTKCSKRGFSEDFGPQQKCLTMLNAFAEHN